MTNERSIFMFLFCNADKLLLLHEKNRFLHKLAHEFMYAGFAVNT